MIQELKETDYSTVFKMLKDYFNVDYEKIDIFEKFLIYKDKSVIGLLSYSIIYERAELNYILVLPEFRNKNIASILLEVMFKDLKNENVNSITLEVKEDNIPAIRLYEKHRFHQVAIRKNYYGKKNGLLMEKEVGD